MDAQIRKDKNWVYKQIWGLQMSIDKQGGIDNRHQTRIVCILDKYIDKHIWSAQTCINEYRVYKHL